MKLGKIEKLSIREPLTDSHTTQLNQRKRWLHKRYNQGGF